MLCGLILLPFFERNENSFSKFQKVIILLISVMLIILILTGLYATFTPVHNNLIHGVQGRYFVPVFILILLAMIKKQNIEIKNLEAKYFITYTIINLLTFLIIFKKFI